MRSDSPPGGYVLPALRSGAATSARIGPDSRGGTPIAMCPGMIDVLTGALDRKGLCHWMEEQLPRSLGAGRRVLALYLDLDHFRKINHRFGHAVGDEVLQRWVEAVRALLLPHDVVARVGGNELVVILDREEAPDAEALLCAMRREVRTSVRLPDREVEFSAGLLPLDAAVGFDTLLIEGEQRMFRARHCWRSMFAPEAPVVPQLLH